MTTSSAGEGEASAEPDWPGPGSSGASGDSGSAHPAGTRAGWNVWPQGHWQRLTGSVLKAVADQTMS